ncbi:MAG: thioredoxin domain-containing protein [Candidatus Fermentibacteraceae bacterium]|nr:thioredoxin domain-containing protein [Candidatus Fermentibacteraceae bacterium]
MMRSIAVAAACALVLDGCGNTGGGDISHAGTVLSNRLSEESSPYLLQHSGNPVHWQPWDDAAFLAARKLDRPIFLSIGYSSCHWCHVMEEESFRDAAVADRMNRAFICIKVDREERPDLDNVYMRYAMAMTGSGGWPLNLVLTPDGKPFFAATYIPRESGYGRRGMLELVPLIEDAWSSRREELMEAAEDISSVLLGPVTDRSGEDIREDPSTLCFRELQVSYDETRGGFGSAPRFPSPNSILFLLRYYHYSRDEASLGMAVRTLAAVRYGGIWDQLGGGLHRYATDMEWHVPHFEKMLYDQALVAIACLEAFQATEEPFFACMAVEILDFVIEEMRSPMGGFCSAFDADSPGGEGAYYTWSREELEGSLDPATAAELEDLWGIDGLGDLTGLPGGIPGRNVPRLELPPPGMALPDSPPGPDARARARLLEVRELRPSPFLDTKVLADWNGLTIAALARASWVLGRPDFLDAATGAMSFVRDSMTLEDGAVLHSWISGSASRMGFLDDQAFIIWACIEMHTATHDHGYLDMALELQSLQDRLYLDPATGAYRFSEDDDDAIDLPETIESFDGAVPSGNSVTLSNLYRLWGLTGEYSMRRRADSLGEALRGRAVSAPSAHAMLAAAMLSGPEHVHVTITGDPSDPAFAEMMKAAGEAYSPDLTVSVEENENEVRAVVCAAGTCSSPAASPSRLRALLAGDD